MTRAIECSMGVSVVKGEVEREAPRGQGQLATFELFGYILAQSKMHCKEF